MDLKHQFTVPTPVEETWSHFQDIAELAECFPGATVDSVEEESFSGQVKVKLGPIAMMYKGSGTFVERDHDAHTFKVDAKGKDKRGNGTAGATVNLSMTDTGGSTEVEVLTDLAVTGKPAQFGRGVMQDVSDKLLGQFVACLEQRLVGGGEEAAGATGSADPAGSGSASSAAASSEDTAAAASGPASSAPSDGASGGASGEGSTTPSPAASTGDEAQGQPAPAAASPAAPTASGSTTAGAASASAGSSTAARPSGGGARSSSDDDALDLGTAVIPVIAKAYWKQGLAAGVVLAVIAWLVGRK